MLFFFDEILSKARKKLKFSPSAQFLWVVFIASSDMIFYEIEISIIIVIWGITLGVTNGADFEKIISKDIF